MVYPGIPFAVAELIYAHNFLHNGTPGWWERITIMSLNRSDLLN